MQRTLLRTTMLISILGLIGITANAQIDRKISYVYKDNIKDLLFIDFVDLFMVNSFCVISTKLDKI
jgi:hypothetical protein